jgi:hypothetical protein
MKIFVAFDIDPEQAAEDRSSASALAWSAKGEVGPQCKVELALLNIPEYHVSTESPRAVLGVRVRRSTARTLAAAADARGMSQRLLLLRGLIAQGIPVHPLDLEDEEEVVNESGAD